MTVKPQTLHPQWEYGGDFPWPQPSELAPLLRRNDTPSLFGKGVFFGTGRAAILALLEHGKINRGWRRLWVPSYFCPRVVETIETAGWNCPRYADTPISQPHGLPNTLEPGDVVLRMNFFGWRGAVAIPETNTLNCDVIEDHSHDPFGPWATGSRSAYCVVSLRKTLPIPDGGWLWSPTHQSLPSPLDASELHLKSVGYKIAGMTLKQHYRAGLPVDKGTFREMLINGETLLGTGEPRGMHPFSKALLESICPLALGKRRRENYEILINSYPSLRRYTPATHLPPKQTPFAVVLVFESLLAREHAKAALIKRNIYPSILWSLPNSSDTKAADFGNRTLTLQCHYQYSEEDLTKASKSISSILADIKRDNT